jgi:hypothetical protein
MEHFTTLGRLSQEWWGEKWDARLRWFNEDGTRNHHGLGKPWPERFEDLCRSPGASLVLFQLGSEEKAALLKMLKGMLAYRPGGRLNVDEVLNSEWMADWALPQLKRMRKM